MHRKGINYDVGTFARRDEPSRASFDPAIVQREIEIIKNDLHCNAIRISGQEIARLTLAAEYALRQGLEVWFSPTRVDATEQETLAYLAQCAQAAEQLRQQSSQVIFVVGC
ncbi:MAG TPA: abortive infection protein, partial [Ktedonobacteraceae bacterium]|nr:abortive infection protein [Ktedonobacteraceae bacterium]